MQSLCGKPLVPLNNMPIPLIQQQLEKLRKQFKLPDNTTKSGYGMHADIEVAEAFLLTALEAVEAEATKVERDKWRDYRNGQDYHCGCCSFSSRP